MEQTNSSKIYYAKEVERIVNGIAASKPELELAAIESLDELLEAEAPLFPYHPNFDEAVRHPVVVLHSSGSTGLPKPVIMTHGTFTVMDNDRNFPTVEGRKNHDLTIWDFDGTPSRIYEPFPPFHLAGFHNKIMTPLYTNAIPVFGPPLRPPSGALVADILKQQKIRGCILPPSVVEQLLHESNGLELIKQLDIVCYAGGPLSRASGDQISKVTMVCQFYGSTEVGQIRQLVPRLEDWSYMEFHPDTRIRFQPSDDDAFELVVLADATTEESASLNHNYPEVKEWHTKDLFRPHPTKKNLWHFHGRKDDILVLSNGEKLNPVPMESQLQALPSVSGALVTGQNRFQPALLIEMNNMKGENESDLIDQIWPTVESANINMPGHGRIIRSMILLVKKPFVRGGKGTVVRKLTEHAYADEIEDLYSGRRQRFSTNISPLVATAFSSDATDKLIRSILPSTLSPGNLKDSDDLYVSGLDSLKTMEAVEALRSSLLPHRAPADIAWLSAETFYNNPSISQLSQLVEAFLNHGAIPQKKDRIAEMSKILESFASTLTLSRTPRTIDQRFHGLSIALTGTTGTLGTYLLDEFSRNPSISRIYCLNRSSMAEQQWHVSCAQRETATSEVTAKLTFITVDFGLKNFGLDYPVYGDLIQGCDLIVHTAWKVDFNQEVSSFVGNIQSVQTIANWSISSPRRPRVVFLSSISSVGPWNPKHRNSLGIPEAPIEDLGAALAIGYSESKQVSERLLDKAATDFQVPVSILRVGQIGGATTATKAKWTQHEVVPSMLKTSKSIGLIPADLPPVDWIPVDIVSKIVAELALKDGKDLSCTSKYYHVINPRPVPWCEFVSSLERYCGPGVQIVPLSQWVKKLRTLDATDMEELSSKPALKMLNFFSLITSYGPTTKYQTSASVEASKTMAVLEPVDQALMQTWLSQSA